jgi:hypothetical protein
MIESLPRRRSAAVACATTALPCLWPAVRALRCCRRFARLYLTEIRDTDYRTKTFSCCRCGTDGALAIAEPNTETGMTDYRLDQVDAPEHHPAAVARFTGPPAPVHRLSAKH